MRSDRLVAAAFLLACACDETASTTATGQPAGLVAAGAAQPASPTPATPTPATPATGAATTETPTPVEPTKVLPEPIPAPAEPWAEPSGHFKVAFPVEPTVSERRVSTRAGTIQMKMYVAPKGEARLGVNWGPLTVRRGHALDVKKSLAMSRDQALAALGASKKREEKIEVNGLAGLEVSFLVAIQDLEARGIMRLFVRRQPVTYYQVTAIAPTSVDEAELRAFVDSFEPAASVGGGIDGLMSTTGAVIAPDDPVSVTTPGRIPASGRFIVTWSDVDASGPAACVFFAGPLSRGTKRSYGQGMGTAWKLSGKRASLSFGGLVDFSGKLSNGRATLRHSERASLGSDSYTFTEAVTGRFDATGRFVGRYTYRDCKEGGAEPCPGPCTLGADLVATPQ